MRKRLLSTLVATAFSTTFAHAAIINPSFEDGGGSLTGWTGNPGALTSAISGAPGAVDGSFFAALSAGTDPGVYTTLSQTVVLGAGDVVSGYAFFRSNDYLPYNDDGYVNIGGGIAEFTASVFTVGNCAGHTTPGSNCTGPTDGGWVPFSFTAPSAGSYLIEGGVRNNPDGSNASLLFLDNFSIQACEEDCTTVPEPGSMLLFATGLLAFGLARRKKGT